jgi:hypothetical protein
MATDHTSCQYCGSSMTRRSTASILGWAGDGPYEEFAGILADVSRLRRLRPRRRFAGPARARGRAR